MMLGNEVMRACGGQGLVWDSDLGLQLGAKTGNKSEKNCSKMSQTVGVRGGGGGGGEAACLAK